MTEKIYHVVLNADGVWDVSQNQRSEFIVHKKDEIMRNSNSHGGDLYPPKDKK